MTRVLWVDWTPPSGGRTQRRACWHARSPRYKSDMVSKPRLRSLRRCAFDASASTRRAACVSCGHGKGDRNFSLFPLKYQFCLAELSANLPYSTGTLCRRHGIASAPQPGSVGSHPLASLWFEWAASGCCDARCRRLPSETRRGVHALAVVNVGPVATRRPLAAAAARAVPRCRASPCQ